MNPYEQYTPAQLADELVENQCELSDIATRQKQLAESWVAAQEHRAMIIDAIHVGRLAVGNSDGA